jgi:hypothetical protein
MVCQEEMSGAATTWGADPSASMAPRLGEIHQERKVVVPVPHERLKVSFRQIQRSELKQERTNGRDFVD